MGWEQERALKLGAILGRLTRTSKGWNAGSMKGVRKTSSGFSCSNHSCPGILSENAKKLACLGQSAQLTNCIDVHNDYNGLFTKEIKFSSACSVLESSL